MVETRSQRRKLLAMAGESRVGSSHGAKDATMAFIEKLLERMEDLEAYWTKKMDLVEKDQEANSKMKEELDELRTQHEYTDILCTQLEVKVVRHNSGGGVPHVKVKESESYDGTRSAKTLGNFLWDMEQYLERLGLSDDETKLKVVAQFLTKDAKMWWQRRMDQISNGNAGDITSWDEMKKDL
eukprot:PITA_05661